jgi:hypothetical protein
MNSEIYQLFDRATPLMVAWTAIFLVHTVGQIIYATFRGGGGVRSPVVSSEITGFPLVAMHTVCFGYSVWLGDWVSAILFGWWGPGFVYFAYIVITRKRDKIEVDWSKHGKWTSIACKIYYVVLVIALYLHGAYGPIFCYSLWIMHDQVALAWFQHNADRSRRLSEDFWVLRVAYPAFLTVPFFDPSFPFRTFASVLAIVTIVFWITAMYRVVTKFEFSRRPLSYTENLRDIVYLKSREQDETDD